MKNQNIFDLPNPDNLYCVFASYADTHNVLNLRILDSSKADIGIHLLFGHVAYHEGPVFWQGANFRFASDKEFYDLLSEIDPNNIYASDLVLYIAESKERISCRILAVYGSKDDRNGTYPAIRPETLLGN